MGFILLGVFSWNLYALQGSVITLLAHGVSAAALFMLAGALQERLHTRELSLMGGLWGQLPRLGALSLFFSVAALGLPGLGNFTGEFLVLLGAFSVNPLLTCVTVLALILAPAYALTMLQKIFYGPTQASQASPGADCSRREGLALGLLAIVTICFGISSQTVLKLSDFALRLEMQPAIQTAQK
jgi:NADH-quinone oxidoreductase subunit M